MAYLDISKFFGNSNSSGLGSINLSDYKMIKSGSYKKLMKSYYSKDNETARTSKTDNTKKKAQAKDTTGLSQMKTQADTLKTTAEKLASDDLWKQKNGAYDTEGIASAVKAFASDYNSVVKQAEKVTSSDVTQQTGYMTSLSRTMAGALSKVGVTVDAEGRMSVDEEKLKGADMKNVKALFNGSKSYTSQVSQNAKAISSAALRNQSLYSSNGMISSTLSGMFDDSI